MFTPREAMAYKGQLPEQRNPKLPPDLLNLLAIQSAMRAKKDAENQLASALGNPNQPTVADALKQKATEELQSAQGSEDQLDEQSQPEKMGLAALAAKNQGVPPQAPQGMPQAQGVPQGMPRSAPQAPQGAPRMMAAGGLAAAQSNLPKSYQNGGIVAFGGGGQADGEDVYSPEGVLVSGPSTQVEGSDETLRERLGLGNKANRLAIEKIGKPLDTPSSRQAAAIKEVNEGMTDEQRAGRVMSDQSAGYVPPVAIPKEKLRAEERDATPVEFNPFEIAVNKVLSREGGKVANDAGKGMTSYGINQTANPDVDVANITVNDAKNIYQQRYWNSIGGNALAAQNPVLAEIAFDTAVNQGQSVAKKLLAESKGDVEKFNELRKKSYEQIVKNDKTKAQYLPAWLNRADSALQSAQSSMESGVYMPAAARSAGEPLPAVGSGLAALVPGKKAAAEPSALSRYIERSLEEGAPEEAGTAASERSKAAYSEGDAAMLKQQQDYLSKKLALQESAKASRPDDFTTFLNLIGKNANKPRGQEFAGVSEGMSASKAAQQAQEMKNLDEINGLQVAMEQAKASGNIRAYLASEKALEKAIASQPSIASSGASMANVQEQTAERRQRLQEQIANKVQQQADALVAKGLATQNQIAKIVGDVSEKMSTKIMINPDWQAAQKAKNTKLMEQILDNEINTEVQKQFARTQSVLNQFNPASAAPGTITPAATASNRPALGSFQR